MDMQQEQNSRFRKNKKQQSKQRHVVFGGEARPEVKYQNLQRNRTQSQVSYEGNTIDMVRLVKKNEQARRSRINIDRKQYQKYQQQQSNQKSAHRYSQTHQMQLYPDYANLDGKRQSSTYGHQGTATNIDNQFIEHYSRPSNVNLLPNSTHQGNNRVVGFTLLILFLVLLSTQILTGAYLLNASHVIYQHQEYALVMQFDQYSIYFYILQYYNFLIVLTVYLAAECLYHVLVFLIQKQTNGKYKLIDKQTSRLQYILRCREIRRDSQSFIQKMNKSPYFTIFLVAISSILYNYGIVSCYYYSQFNFVYDSILSNQIILLIQLFYFAQILPGVIKYIFFQKMHIKTHGRRTQLDNSQESANSDYFNPLTTFNIQTWWSKLALLILFISVGYSMFISYWLIIVAFAKIEITFKKMKYRIDTFYIEAFTKSLFLIFCVTGLLLRDQNFISFTFDYGIECVTLIIFAMLLSRILANFFIRNQLYKYFYSEMHINSAIILFLFGQVYLITLTSYYFQYINLYTFLIGMYSFFLMLCTYTQGSHRLTITFDQNDPRKSDYYVEMGSL